MKSFSDLANPWIEGLLTYEPGKPIDEVARELGFDNAEEITKIASNENSLGPSPLAIEAMRDNAANMHRYPDGGAFYLKQALADKLGVKTDEVLPAAGSNELLEFLGHVFLSSGTNIVMADCAFIVYKLISAVFQADVIPVAMKNFTHDLDAMIEAITPDTKIVFISNPNNPTSTMVNAEAIESFMDRVPDHVIVCFDEAYIELLPNEKQPDTIKYIRDGRKVVVLRTFSKTYGLAGLRIGYAVASSECISLMNRVRQPFNVNAMAMAAGVAALQDDAHVERTREMVTSGIKYFEEQFDLMGLAFVPPVANFILVETGNGREVFERLQREGFIVRAMDAYGLPSYIRVTVGTVDENRGLCEALERVLTEMGQA